MGTIHRKAGTHDRHENIWSIGTVERIAAQIRLYPRLDCYGSQRAGSRHQGFKIAVVTSSQNCEAVLKAAKLDAFFDVRVDGNTIRAQHLAGKPAPDTFLTAAQQLGVVPTRAVVVENAISGVEAGCSGNFGLVIGVARKGNTEELRHHGAHLVVNDLGELASRPSLQRTLEGKDMMHALEPTPDPGWVLIHDLARDGSPVLQSSLSPGRPPLG
jgi:hypothetical protein